MNPSLKKFSYFSQSKNTPLIACVLSDQDVFALDDNSLNKVDLIELRIDMFDDLSLNHVGETLKAAKNKFNKPLITTVRDVNEGGQKVISDRFTFYEIAAPLSDFVDVEVNSESLMRQVKDILQGRTILIGSYHNFDLTPQDEFLEGIITKGRSLGADIVKVAVMAKDRDDLIRFMLFTLRHKDAGVITMSMGDYGVPSRVVSPVFGSLITYGYLNKPSAPGQLSVSQLSEILRLIKLR